MAMRRRNEKVTEEPINKVLQGVYWVEFLLDNTYQVKPGEQRNVLSNNDGEIIPNATMGEGRWMRRYAGNRTTWLWTKAKEMIGQGHYVRFRHHNKCYNLKEFLLVAQDEKKHSRSCN